MVVKPCDYAREQVAELDKVNHHPVRIWRPSDRGGNGPIVAVESFAEVVGQRDKVACRKDVNSFAEFDCVAFARAFVHRLWLRMRGIQFCNTECTRWLPKGYAEGKETLDRSEGVAPSNLRRRPSISRM